MCFLSKLKLCMKPGGDDVGPANWRRNYSYEIGVTHSHANFLLPSCDWYSSSNAMSRTILTHFEFRRNSGDIKRIATFYGSVGCCFLSFCNAQCVRLPNIVNVTDLEIFSMCLICAVYVWLCGHVCDIGHHHQSIQPSSTSIYPYRMDSVLAHRSHVLCNGSVVPNSNDSLRPCPSRFFFHTTVAHLLLIRKAARALPSDHTKTCEQAEHYSRSPCDFRWRDEADDARLNATLHSISLFVAPSLSGTHNP